MTTIERQPNGETQECGNAPLPRLAPRLSVTVLNYNYGRYLPACLDSILAQTMADFEIILIDDCSTDDSLTVIQPYLSDPRVCLVDHKVNQGYVDSLLQGCGLSRGQYITVISADDYALDKTAFAEACRVMDSDAEIALSYSAWHEMDDAAHVRHTRRASDGDYIHAGVDEVRRMLMSSPVLHSGAVIRRSAYDLVGGYDARCRYSVDTNMWLALCLAGKIAYLDKPLYAYRAHNSNMSNSGGALWRATAEMLLGIEFAMERFTDDNLPERRALKRQAIQRALVAVPTLDIFAGRYPRGWHGYALSLLHHPWLTLMQPRLFSLVARTLLGARGYDRLIGNARREITSLSEGMEPYAEAA